MFIFLNKKNINHFLTNYNVGQLLNYKKIKKGFANTIVDIQTTKGRYILKIVVRNNPYRIRYEVDLLNFIKGLPTPKPIKTRDNKYLINFNKINKAFIYKYLPGQQKDKFSKVMLRQVGRFLGKMHLQTKHFKSSIKRIKWYTISPKYFKKIIKACEKIKSKKIRKWIFYIEKNLMRYKMPKLPQGAIQVDIKPENTLFVGDKLTGVVDFDNSYNGPLLLDLASTIMWFCSKEGKFDIIKAREIYLAYKKVRKITKLEREYFFETLHHTYLSHVLMNYYFLATGFCIPPMGYLKWEMADFLETEKNLSIPKDKFKSIFY